MAHRPYAHAHSPYAFVEPVEKRILYSVCGGVCALCGQPVSYKQATLDHIVPRARGGAHTYTNLQITHPYCNRRKGMLLMHELDDSLRYAPAPKQKTGFFNSRSYRASQVNQQRRAA